MNDTELIKSEIFCLTVLMCRYILLNVQSFVVVIAVPVVVVVVLNKFVTKVKKHRLKNNNNSTSMLKFKTKRKHDRKIYHNYLACNANWLNKCDKPRNFSTNQCNARLLLSPPLSPSFVPYAYLIKCAF